MSQSLVARPLLSPSDIELLLESATRYALGRSTYIVGATVQLLVDQEPWLSNRARQVLRRDIGERLNGGNVGMECDAKEWRRALKALEEGAGE